jgi:nucleotidyltransferase/DNA polymerase involved in DNA repair
MGFLTIGQLARYDVQNLMDRFDKKSGLWRWRVANGKDENPVIPRFRLVLKVPFAVLNDASEDLS